MSLGSALNAAVSGLNAQSSAIAVVSQNISNVSTTAYKTTDIRFESLVSDETVAGGVTFQVGQNMGLQGTIENTGSSTNIAINGQGFFVVTSNPDALSSEYKYTRNGDFSTDEDGLLINNEGYILLGYATDSAGNVLAASTDDLNSLTAVDLGAISSTARATSEVDMSLNLPADASVGDVFTTTLEIFDELGVSHTVEASFEKAAVNTWTVSYDDPYQTSLGAGSGATATIAPATQTVSFNGDGSINLIDGVAADAFSMTFTGFTATTGSNDLNIEVNIGTSGSYSGFTQYSSDDGDAQMTLNSIEQDGVRFGQLTGVEIGDDGIVTAVFDNGVRQAIYQIPVATFSNADALVNVSGTVYDESENAGNLNLRLPGDGSAGTLVAESIEISTVDTSTEFNNMIVAQQAYSAAAQVVSTVDDMFDTLITSVR